MRDLLETELKKYFPGKLVVKLLTHYSRLKSNYANNKLEPGELNGGKFSEIVLRMLQHATEGQHRYTPLTQSLPRIDDLVRGFEQLPRSFHDSLRLHIPRAIKALYGIRSKRGVGHTGDIDANLMDATFVVTICDWILAELIRLYHKCPPEDAQKIVDQLVRRSVPLVYDKDGIRTLLTKVDYDRAVLLFLHYEGGKDVPIGSLCRWVEHPNVTNFRKTVLRKLHKERKIYLDEKKKVCRILPPGAKLVEEVIVRQLTQ